ncbi:MAG: type I-B CRISPR-associated protein Cas7/Csh2, partial [Chloroflexota bacterium]|nr:type I-B CRISPR-associated protein Cas7/Csh2 [Chloroflexota bacterium]
EIVYEPGFQGLLSALDEKVSLTRNGKPLDVDEQLSLRSLDEVTLDLTPIVNQLAAQTENIQNVGLRVETRLSLEGLDQMKAILKDKLKITSE